MMTISELRGGPQPSGVEVQAASIRSREAFVRERFGPEGVRRFREGASRELTRILDGQSSGGGWAPFARQIEATELIDRLFGAGDLALANELGASVATHDAGVWKSLFMRAVPPALMARIIPSLWSHYYRHGGALRMQITGASALTIREEGFPAPHRAHCLAMIGWARATLEQGPRTDVRVTEHCCRMRGEEVCEFHVTWR